MFENIKTYASVAASTLNTSNTINLSEDQTIINRAEELIQKSTDLITIFTKTEILNGIIMTLATNAEKQDLNQNQQMVYKTHSDFMPLNLVSYFKVFGARNIFGYTASITWF